MLKKNGWTNRKKASKTPSLRKRHLPSMMCAFVFLLGVFIFGIYRLQQIHVRDKIENRFDSVQRLMADYLDNESDQMGAAMDVLLKNSKIAEAFERPDRQDLLRLSNNLFSRLRTRYDITHFYFTMPDRVNLLRVHKPDKYGDIIERYTTKTAAITGEKAQGLELGPLGTLTLRVVMPWHEEGKLIGFVEMGKEINHIIQRLHRALGLDLYVILEKQFLDREGWVAGMQMLERNAQWDRFPTTVLIDSTAETVPEKLESYFDESSHIAGDTTVSFAYRGNRYRSKSLHLYDAAGRGIGDIVLLQNVTADSRRLFRLLALVAGISGLVFAGLFALFYVRLGRTDRRLTEAGQKLLAYERDRSRLVLDDMPALVCRFAPDGELTFVNSEFCRYFDCVPEKMRGRSLNEIFPPEHMESVQKLRYELSPEQAVARYGMKINDSAGKPVWQEWIARAIFNEDGEITEYQAVGRDVTEEKLAEREKLRLEEQIRQSQKMEALGTLAGGIAHDFNNILSAVLGYSELSLAEVDPESQLGKNIQQILDGGHRARDLVKQILTFTRQSIQEPQPVQVKLIVKEAVKLLRASLPATIQIREQIESESLVMADPVQIHQIVMNLCTNAGHAMDDTGGRLTVHLTEKEFETECGMGVYCLSAGRYVRLLVEDTGPGIADNIRDRIFEPYFTTKGKGEGTGLGLSMVHGIVEGLGGAIDLKTGSGQGTAFAIFLPVMSAGDKSQVSESENHVVGGSERVLFVDDEPAVVRMAEMMLKKLGYKPVACDSGAEALHRFRQAPEAFDLVITDMTMPAMTGLELARKIAAMRPDVPVILCSGYSAKLPADVTGKTTIKAVARKPLSFNEFARLIRRVLES